jgi:pyridoxine/pyridoxamine 5'-phosphate oxidase
VQQQLLDFLRTCYVGSLATISENGTPQAATVFYVADNSGGMVFKSRRMSDHMKSLFANPHAAMSVYDHGSNYSDKVGAQLIGSVSRITDPKLMQSYVAQYCETFPGASAKFSPIDVLVSPDSASTLFRFQIEQFKFTNTFESLSPERYTKWLLPNE